MEIALDFSQSTPQTPTLLHFGVRISSCFPCSTLFLRGLLALYLNERAKNVYTVLTLFSRGGLFDTVVVNSLVLRHLWSILQDRTGRSPFHSHTTRDVQFSFNHHNVLAERKPGCSICDCPYIHNLVHLLQCKIYKITFINKLLHTAIVSL